MSDDDNVTRLPVRFKAPPDESFTLVRKEDWSCLHGHFIVDPKKSEVECGKCGEKLNPMWVLSWLAGEEHRWHRGREIYQEEMKRLEERRRTKCDHCGQMTRISRR